MGRHPLARPGHTYGTAMESLRRVESVTGGALAHPSTQSWLLAGHLLLGGLVGVLFATVHPYPLEHPDPVQYRRIVRVMLTDGTLLVTWDPPLRYFLHFDLALLADGSVATIDRLGVFQAAVYGYVLVPLAVYGLFSTIRGPAAGLAGAITVTFARVATLPPTGVVWHHWQVDAGYPWAVTAVALAVATVRTRSAGRSRVSLGYAALTAACCGLTLNAEPWIALFVTVGIASAWASHLAVRELAVASLVGLAAGAPVLLIPRWEAHLAIFVVSVIDPYGPLFSFTALWEGTTTVGTLGVVGLFGGMAWLHRKGTPIPGGWITAFAILAGLLPWGLFQVTTLSGIGIRGLYWSLLIGIPAGLLQVVDHVGRDHPVRTAYRDLFTAPDLAAWAVLFLVEAILLVGSVGLFVVTYQTPS